MKKTDQRRRFLGTVGNSPSDYASKGEMAFEKKHLKAYLRGNAFFQFGFKTETMSTTGLSFRVPNFVKVKQEFYYV